ncbi:unannotated protein [freshwater metagenome]
MRLAPKKPISITNSGPHTRRARLRRHFHRSVSTRKKISVVIAIVMVTAMPYAAARFDDERNPSTKPTQAIMSTQFTSGT